MFTKDFKKNYNSLIQNIRFKRNYKLGIVVFEWIPYVPEDAMLVCPTKWTV